MAKNPRENQMRDDTIIPPYKYRRIDTAMDAGGFEPPTFSLQTRRATVAPSAQSCIIS